MKNFLTDLIGIAAIFGLLYIALVGAHIFGV
jgi:hypothetical protein